MQKIKDPEQKKEIYIGVEDDGVDTGKKSKVALTLFLVGIVLIAIFPEVVLPIQPDGKPFPISQVLQFVMIAKL